MCGILNLFFVWSLGDNHLVVFHTIASGNGAHIIEIFEMYPLVSWIEMNEHIWILFLWLKTSLFLSFLQYSYSSEGFCNLGVNFPKNVNISKTFFENFSLYGK